MSSSSRAAAPVEVDIDLLGRLDCIAPRYTSYPTAERFVTTFRAAAYKAWTQKRSISATRRLALYVQMPYCASLRRSAGSGKAPVVDKTETARYLHYLCREAGMHGALFADRPCVEQLRWGGSAPAFFSVAQMLKLMNRLRDHFSFSASGEYTIEIDPCSVEPQIMHALAAMGFNRVSLRGREFDPGFEVLRAGTAGERQALEIMLAARRAGFRSINIDLLYGRPAQTLLSLLRGLDQVIRARPERITLYNYARMPRWFGLREPDTGTRPAAAPDHLEMLRLAVRRLNNAGYNYIGVDHFVVPEDELATAQREGRLYRNFFGYSTYAESNLVALGPGAVGAMGPTYWQNLRALPDYYRSLTRGVLPIVRGMQLSADDLTRRAVIQALMCRFELSIEAIEATCLVDFANYFAAELKDLAEFEREGMLINENGWITVTPKGRLLIRNICMVFDKYLRLERATRSLAQAGSAGAVAA